MEKQVLPLSRVYQLLEPGPVTLVTTALHGKANVMTMSWQTMLDFEPPLFACVISNRNHSFDALVQTKECVINIPTVELAALTVKIGNVSGRKVDKFKKFHIAQEPAAKVEPPLLSDCYASLECRVVDTKMVEKYNLFILEVIAAWIRPSRKRARMIHHQGKGVFAVDGKVLKLPSKMK